MIKLIIALIAAFVMGMTFQGIYAELGQSRLADKTLSTQPDQNEPAFAGIFPAEPKEVESPYDWIKEEQIHVYDNRIVIELQNPEWASFTDSNSMDPVIDYGSNAIEIVPQSTDDIHLGDIVSYESKFATGTIIHRVAEIGKDDQGWYCRMKGDNIDIVDPGKVRFDQIRRVVVAIIY